MAGKLTPTIRTEIARRVALGMSTSRAAISCGVDHSTASLWRKRGREDLEAGRNRTRHALFELALREAGPKGEYALRQAVATDEDWRAKAFILARSYGVLEPKAPVEGETGNSEKKAPSMDEIAAALDLLPPAMLEAALARIRGE